MTRADIRTEVRKLIKEDTASFWSDALLNRFIDDALLVYSSRVGLKTREQSTSSVNAQENYLLPSDFVFPEGERLTLPPSYFCKYNGKILQYAPIMAYQLIRGYGVGATLGTTPVFFTYYNALASGASFLWNLKLLPTPDENGSQNIIIGYPATVPKLTAESQTPELPEEDHEAIAWQAGAFAFLHREQTEQAAPLQALFDRRVAERLPIRGSVGATG